MIQDLHSHTYYSFCGADSPEAVVEAAVAGGIELIGITDHNYGVGDQRTDVYFSQVPEIKNDYERTLKRYYDHINLVKEKYESKYNAQTVNWFISNLPHHVKYINICLDSDYPIGFEYTTNLSTVRYAISPRISCV